MSLAWHIQRMAPERSRNGRMPSLEKLMNREKQSIEPRRQTPEQMREASIAMTRAFGGKITKLTEPLPEPIRLPT